MFGKEKERRGKSRVMKMARQEREREGEKGKRGKVIRTLRRGNLYGKLGKG